MHDDAERRDDALIEQRLAPEHVRRGKAAAAGAALGAVAGSVLGGPVGAAAGGALGAAITIALSEETDAG
jgi:uncharacterized protein YcfJ